MIYINCATQQDYIISTLEQIEGDITFKFDKKQGMKLGFCVSTEDLDSAITLAKTTLKGSSLGSSLYFQVTK